MIVQHGTHGHRTAHMGIAWHTWASHGTHGHRMAHMGIAWHTWASHGTHGHRMVKDDHALIKTQLKTSISAEIGTRPWHQAMAPGRGTRPWHLAVAPSHENSKLLFTFQHFECQQAPVLKLNVDSLVPASTNSAA